MNTIKQATPTPGVRLSVLQLAALGVVGFVAVVLSTTWGIALSNDSVNYVRAARAPLEGREFIIVQYQPLYPALLALGGLLGADILAEARWLGALTARVTPAASGSGRRRSTGCAPGRRRSWSTPISLRPCSR